MQVGRQPRGGAAPAGVLAPYWPRAAGPWREHLVPQRGCQRMVLYGRPLAILLFATATMALPLGPTNLRPVIGVVSEPLEHHAEAHSFKTNATSYIAASYVKFLEASGARVVPLRFDSPRDQLAATLSGLNGVLYPGGGASLAADSPFFQGAQFIWEHAIKANQAGHVFPVWGTCLGFELIGVVGVPPGPVPGSILRMASCPG